jgi:hypothetical protein
MPPYFSTLTTVRSLSLEILVPDGDGQELESIEVAKAEAQAALSDMARDRLPDGDQRVFIVRVRDETGQGGPPSLANDDGGIPAPRIAPRNSIRLYMEPAKFDDIIWRSMYARYAAGAS